ncbi:MAG: nucleotide exchange factor GrpE [Pseudolysinimonas sp.]
MAAQPPKDQTPKDQTPKDDNPGDEPVVNDKRKVDPETGEVREPAPGAESASDPDVADGMTDLSDDDLAILDSAERDLVAEYCDRAARAEAELKNFRTRVERDRAANREVVIAEVLRNLLPSLDDLDRAEAHGDLVDGSPLALVAVKLRAGFERYGLVRIGEKGEVFDPKLHEAILQVYSKDVTVNTVADVIEPGYALGDRLLRAAKVAVSVPEP